MKDSPVHLHDIFGAYEYDHAIAAEYFAGGKGKLSETYSDRYELEHDDIINGYHLVYGIGSHGRYCYTTAPIDVADMPIIEAIAALKALPTGDAIYPEQRFLVTLGNDETVEIEGNGRVQALEAAGIDKYFIHDITPITETV